MDRNKPELKSIMVDKADITPTPKYDPESDAQFQDSVNRLAELVAEQAMKDAPESGLKSPKAIAAERREGVIKDMTEFRDQFARGYQLVLAGVKKCRAEPEHKAPLDTALGSSMKKI